MLSICSTFCDPYGSRTYIADAFTAADPRAGHYNLSHICPKNSGLWIVVPKALTFAKAKPPGKGAFSLMAGAF